MKRFIIFLFCVFSGATFGIIAGGVMFGRIGGGLAMFVGGVLGGGIGFLVSPAFVFSRRGERIFLHLVVCYVAAFPISVLSALSYIPQLAVAMVLVTIIATFWLLGREAFTQGEASIRRGVFIIPTALLIVAGIAAYLYDDLPDDAPSLIEMLADNDSSRHIAAGKKLSKKYGKEPLLTGLQHADARVRGRSAHLLGLLRDPSVIDELVKASNDPDQHVRMWVAFSLGEIGDQQVLTTLLILASDEQEIVRRQAAESIAKIKKKELKGP